jgi:hypothetical protein
MNTFSIKLDRITREFPEYSDAIDRLTPIFMQASLDGGKRVYSTARLFEILNPKSFEQLKGILLSLEREGVVKKILRIEPVGRQAIMDFNNISEIPEEIHDENNDEIIQVNPENIKLYYRYNAE